MANGGFAARFWEAYKELEKREGRIPQGRLAERIAAAGGHATRQDDVSRWIRSTSRPEYEELPAIAEVLGVDLMWLTFGPMEEVPTASVDSAAKRPADIRARGKLRSTTKPRQKKEAS